MQRIAWEAFHFVTAQFQDIGWALTKRTCEDGSKPNFELGEPCTDSPALYVQMEATDRLHPPAIGWQLGESDQAGFLARLTASDTHDVGHSVLTTFVQHSRRRRPVVQNRILLLNNIYYTK